MLTRFADGVHAMKIVVAASILTMSSLIAPAYAQSPITASEFAMKASVGNTFEVEESKLALKQAASAKVKAFARMMIKDHTAAEKKLMAAAKGAGPVEMKLDEPHQTMVTALQSQTGDAFDKAYVADQVQSHQETAALLGDYATSGDNAKLKTWAKLILPKVEMHLKKVQAMPAQAAL